MVPVCTPPCLHDIALADPGGQTGTEASPHHIHYYARDLSRTGKPEVLLHQRKAGAAGRRHRLDPGERGPYNSAKACDLIFHLYEDAIDSWEPR